jgi:ADP-heptose:LPS heptosyltransferase
VTGVLVVRSDNLGDVLLAGPAIRAVAASDPVVLLTGRHGRPIAPLLPGVTAIASAMLPWIEPEPGAWRQGRFWSLVEQIRQLSCRRAVILTSFHQSALPLALALREAGIGHITAISEDYPGNLLDVRCSYDPALHEVERNLFVANAAGFPLPADDDGRLRVEIDDSTALWDPPDVDVVVHPGSSVATRGIPESTARAAVVALVGTGYRVAVTGSAAERSLTAAVAGSEAIDLGGRTDLPRLAALMRSADVLITGNTGPAHLAAAVSTPVISVYAPVVPWHQWRPYGVETIRLGADDAACRDTRARVCPVPGHPCVSRIHPDEFVAAVSRFVSPGHAAAVHTLERLA